MKTQVVEFDIDKKNLLRDVISKQTGSLGKAIKELFQNSFDAGATEIKVKINENSLVFTDNGCGMNADEIYKYFRVFGATQKRGDDKKTGTFGMGRGQIFNFGITLWETQNHKMVVDIRDSLDYNFEETETHIKGTTISITFYKPIYSWHVSDAIYHIKEDVLPPKGVKIYLNKELYEPTIEKYEDFSNDKYLVFTSSEHRSRIYNGGLAVKFIKHTNYKYSIQPYEKLELNFARNELIENTESTKELNYFIYSMEELMASKKNRFNLDEALNILRLLASKRIDIQSVYDKKIVPLSNDVLVSFKEVIENANMGVLFGGKNVWSDDCLRQDYKVISDHVITEIKRIKQNFNLNKLEFLNKTTKELSRKGYHKQLGLENLKKNIQYYFMAVELNEYIFKILYKRDIDHTKRRINLGTSDLSQAWTDGKYNIWINKATIEGLGKKEEAILVLWEMLCHEYSHTRTNTREDQHNTSFYFNCNKMVRKSLPYLAHCIRYINRKFLKEKYRY